MHLKEKLNADLKNALKSGNQFMADVLRLLLAALHNREIDNRAKTGSPELTDEAVIQLLAAEAKKRKEAIEIFIKGSRADLVRKKEQELAIIKTYLPEEISPREVEVKVVQILERLGTKDFGQAMKAVMQELKGRADAKLIAEIVKKKLAN